jgi:hypothetical protein
MAKERISELEDISREILKIQKQREKKMRGWGQNIQELKLHVRRTQETKKEITEEILEQ